MFIFRKEHRLRKFENRVLSKISGAKREIQGTEKNFILSSFLTQYYWSDKMEMRFVRAREIFEGKEKNTPGFC